LLEIRLARHPIDPGDAVNEETSAERAQDEILHSRLERGTLAPHVGDEHVEADRDELQRDKNEEEIDRRGHEHQAGAGENGEAEEFTQTRAVRGAGDEPGEDPSILDRHDKHDDRGEQSESFEEERLRICAVESLRQIDPSIAAGEEREDEDHVSTTMERLAIQRLSAPLEKDSAKSRNSPRTRTMISRVSGE
jgi:hypothetical protein